jgi:hypothetical protein
MAHRYGRREFSSAVRDMALRRAFYRCEKWGRGTRSNFITSAGSITRYSLAWCCACRAISIYTKRQRGAAKSRGVSI